MSKHRLILIGHGNISKAYLNAFSNVDDAEIVGVVGRNLERVKAFAETHNISNFGIDVKEVSHQGRATAAIICTPNALHYDAVMTASQLGLHCLCEKPLDISPKKQEEMISSCEKHGVKLAVSYMRRFIQHLRFIKEVVDSGKLGRIMVFDVTIKHFRPKEYYDSWHGTKALDGGGPFIQQGSHIIDLALWLCGGYKEVLQGKRFQVYHDIETEDHGYALVKYNNGAIGMIEASTASYGLKNEGIEISGTKGSITANYDEIINFDVPGVPLPDFSSSDSSNEALFKELAMDFIKAIETNNPPFIDGESAKKATELIIDIYEKCGEPIKTFS
ncbi:Gfo/Idh/MocA family oxidoreductase [Evansella sp. AB-P1]|uniref:Gfo/Idh/MocA family protein n=1 Tax=Evansella sp. AB-P1 TaxID=3037653 RepID=UPI00241E96ED|nr:Gfo/Idh/MocA family oxidoreductase [Evansella sp. AB-P1]MDG5787866.1 Gfo/Idh/MocA family oxidoreductase [Evansella sp. AB-P1]